MPKLPQEQIAFWVEKYGLESSVGLVYILQAAFDLGYRDGQHHVELGERLAELHTATEDKPSVSPLVERSLQEAIADLEFSVRVPADVVVMDCIVISRAKQITTDGEIYSVANNGGMSPILFDGLAINFIESFDSGRLGNSMMAAAYVQEDDE